MVYYKDTASATLKSLNNEETECLRSRSGLEFQKGSEICLYHYHFYLKAFSNHFNVCCNLLKNHNHSKSTRLKATLKEISFEFGKQDGELNLIPAQKLCYRYKKTIEDPSDIPERDDKYNNDDNDIDCDYEVEGNVKSAEKLNETLTLIDCSPPIKAWKDREIGYRKIKFKEVKDKLVSSFRDVIPGFDDLEIIQLLTLIPEHWSKERASSFFNVTEYMVRTEEKGVLGIPDSIHRYDLSDELLGRVKSFYEDDQISQMCAGEKDFETVKNLDDTKECRQKR